MEDLPSHRTCFNSVVLSGASVYKSFLVSLRSQNAVQLSDGPTWSSLDIFLFSNGQQYSPPRKYNLRADELTWWDTLLSFLARSQYGTEHSSIQLYTIEGKKVEGPLELSHGNAYVAVAPPEPFVQTGYHAYMMKASRSWEKRQQKRNSENIQSKPDKAKVITKPASAEEDNKPNGLKNGQDICIVPTNAALPAAKVTANSGTKPKPIFKPGSRNAAPKQKPKAIIPQQRISILRNRNSKPGSLQQRKITPIAHIGSVKKSDDKSLEKEAALIKTESLLFGQLGKSHLEDSEKSQTISKSEKEKQDKGEPSSILIRAKSTSACDIILQNTVNEKVDGKAERDILPTLMNAEDQHHCEWPNAVTDATIHYDKDEFPVQRNDVELEVIVNSSTNDACLNSDLLSTKAEMHSKVESNTNNVIDKPMNCKDNSVGTGSQIAENFLVFVSKGDMINLKLNIEVNDNNVVSSLNHPIICQKIKPNLVVDDTKSDYEREPPARSIDNNISLTGSVAPAVTKSWQSATVCQCSRGSNPGEVWSIASIPVYVDNNNYFIVLPSEKDHKNFTSCNCGFETLKSEQNTRSVNNGNELKLSKNTSESKELLVQKDFLNDCENNCSWCVLVKNQPAKFDTIQQPAPNETAGLSRPKNFIFDCEMKCQTCDMGKNSQDVFKCIQQPNQTVLNDYKKECPRCSTCQDQPVYVNKKRRYSTLYDCNNGKLREVNQRTTLKTLLDDSTQTDWNNLLVLKRRGQIMSKSSYVDGIIDSLVES